MAPSQVDLCGKESGPIFHKSPTPKTYGLDTGDMYSNRSTPCKLVIPLGISDMVLVFVTGCFWK